MNLRTLAMNALSGTADFSEDHDTSLNPAILELREKLGEAWRGHLPEAVLVGFIPDLATEHPLLAQTFEMIEKHWAFVQKKYRDRPVWLIRYTLIAALLQLAEKDDRAASLMYLTLADPASLVTEVNEQVLRNGVLKAWKPAFLTQVNRFWELESPFVPVPAKEPGVTLPEEARAALKNGLKTAHEGMTFTDAVGAAVAVQQPQQWLAKYSQESAEAVVAAIEAGVKQLARQLPTQFRSANQYHTQINGIFALSTRIERQSQLLWWLESKYSVSTEQSYRSLSPEAGALQMVLDFQEVAPLLAPPEVDAVLAEALWSIYPQAALQSRPLNDWLKAWATSAGVAHLPATAGSLLLADILPILKAQPELTGTGILGLEESTTISLPDLTLWLWHTLEIKAQTP
jgi:hypothetical protein